MKLLSSKSKNILANVNLVASKSESNRALIIKALSNNPIQINNLSTANDTIVMQNLLASKKDTLNVEDAGTVMRFLTAFYTTKQASVVLLGSKRMHERPIKVLVNVLRDLNAKISYLGEEGYPPIKIEPNELKGEKVTIDASVSSQYISALLLVAPTLPNGLVIEFKQDVISKPYISMTIEMMNKSGAHVIWNGNTIEILPTPYGSCEINIESDWSAASYWYSFAALSKNATIVLNGLKPNSLQGDSIVEKIYEQFGVSTTYTKEGVVLTKKKNFIFPKNFEYNFKSCPDIAQTVAVTCAALDCKAKLRGLSSLRIKETDRISALKKELEKFLCEVVVDGDSLTINKGCTFNNTIKTIDTYKDHRVALSFAPITLKQEIEIKNPDVINKSYPNFWNDLKNNNVIK